MQRFLFLSAVLILGACAQPGNRPATTADTVDAKPAKPKITAVQLLGQSDQWVLEKLGEPAFRRADSFASIWQYKNNVCVLNVFLYADSETAPSPAHVLHFDARDALGNNTERDPCLSVLQN